MANKQEIVIQCKLAFDFIDKLFMEVSYFVKEVEGLLAEEDFIIGRPSGYQITARGSMGLEPVNVNMWLLKKLSVFFAPRDKMKFEKGQTKLSVETPASIVYLRIVLHDDKKTEPEVYAGVLYDIQKNPKTNWPTKCEQVISHIEYNDSKIFKGDLKHLDYVDGRIHMKGHLFKLPLFELNDSDTIVERVIKPSLALYVKHQQGGCL